jgi:hypothetical protein
MPVICIINYVNEPNHSVSVIGALIAYYLMIFIVFEILG